MKKTAQKTSKAPSRGLSRFHCLYRSYNTKTRGGGRQNAAYAANYSCVRSTVKCMFSRKIKVP